MLLFFFSNGKNILIFNAYYVERSQILKVQNEKKKHNLHNLRWLPAKGATYIPSPRQRYIYIYYHPRPISISTRHQCIVYIRVMGDG